MERSKFTPAHVKIDVKMFPSNNSASPRDSLNNQECTVFF